MFEPLKFEIDSFIIAEIGQNHQGELDKALSYIATFANAGADAVKFQTRDNKYLFAQEAYKKQYNSNNAFAEIYGDHREILELKKEWYPQIVQSCKDHNVRFMCTPFDEPSLKFLVEQGVEILKIASFDLGNLPFIDKIGQTKLPVVMSVGGGKLDQIVHSIETLLKYHSDIAVLHCVSEYPCEYNRLGLDNIQVIKDKYPNLLVGMSDHFNGISSGPVGYMKGARIFEKHVTFNRTWKGTDHNFALEPDGFRKFVRDIRRTPEMFKVKEDGSLGNEQVFIKLGKSLVPAVDIKKGEELTLENLSGKIFNLQYIPVRRSNEVLNKRATRDLKAGEPINEEDFA